MPPGFKQVAFGGGVNLFEDPRLISDAEVQLARNLFPYTPGRVSKRKASRRAGAFAGTAIAYHGFIVPPFASDIFAVLTGEQMIGAPDTNIRLLDATGAAAASWDHHAETPPLSRRLFMFAYQNKIYVLGGSPWTIPAVVASSNGGVNSLAAFAFAGTGNADLNPRVAGVYRERVVWADLGPGFEDYLVFSDPYQPDVIGDDVTDANSRAFRIGARAGDRIVALVEISQGGIDNPSQSGLLVLREHSAYLITGEPNLTTDTVTTTDAMFDTMVVNRINIDTGCISAETVVRTEHGVLWTSGTDVWMMPPSGLPIAVGTKIRPALTRAPALDKVNWHAAYFDGVYRLAIHGEGQGPLTYDTNTSTYDALNDQWWLDLRGGSPRNWKEAAWYGPEVYTSFSRPGSPYTPLYGVYPMSPDLRPGRTPRLLAASAAYASGPASGISELEVAATRDDWYEYPSGTDAPVPRTTQHGYIESKLKTKTYVADGMLNMRFMSEEIRLLLSRISGIRLDIDMDDGRKTQTITKAVVPEGFILPVGVIDTGVLMNPFQALSIYPSSAIVGKDLTLTISDVAGYPVGSYNQTFFWYDRPDGVLPLLRRATLTQGFYNTIDDFVTEVVAALQRSATALYGVGAPVFSWSWVGPNKVNITQTVVAGGIGWGPVVSRTAGVVDFVTQAAAEGIADSEFDISALLWASLGWSIAGNPVWGYSKTADTTEAWYKLIGALEIAAVNTKFDVFGKRP